MASSSEQTKTTPAEDAQDAAAAEDQPQTDKQKLEEDASLDADDSANVQIHARVHRKHHHSHRRRRNMHQEYEPSDHNDVII